jgi:hypothetical protein
VQLGGGVEMLPVLVLHPPQCAAHRRGGASRSRYWLIDDPQQN